MNLLELQRRFNQAVTAPLNSEEGIGERTVAGESMKQVAEEIVKPNDRLSSMERIEIYSRSYWFRIISSLNEDFVGLRAVVGDSKFDALIQAYLAARPTEPKLTSLTRNRRGHASKAARKQKRERAR